MSSAIPPRSTGNSSTRVSNDWPSCGRAAAGSTAALVPRLGMSPSSPSRSAIRHNSWRIGSPRPPGCIPASRSSSRPASATGWRYGVPAPTNSPPGTPVCSTTSDPMSHPVGSSGGSPPCPSRSKRPYSPLPITWPNEPTLPVRPASPLASQKIEIGSRSKVPSCRSLYRTVVTNNGRSLGQAHWGFGFWTPTADASHFR